MQQNGKTFKKGQESLRLLGTTLTEKKEALDKIKLDTENEKVLSSKINLSYNEHEARLNGVLDKFNTAYNSFKLPGKISRRENQSFKSADEASFQAEVSLLEKECTTITDSFEKEASEIIAGATASAATSET